MRRRAPVEDKGTRVRRKGAENASEQFRTLREISIALASMRDLKETLEKIANAALTALETDVIAIFLVDEARHALVGAAGSTSLGAEGLRRLEEAYGATISELEFPLERGKALIVDAILEGKPRLGLSPLWLKEMTRYEGIIPLLDAAKATFGAITVSMVPLMARQRPVGVMIFLGPEHVDRSDEELINAFTSLAAVSIENARAYQNLKTLNQQIIETLVAAIEIRDPYTSGHSFKVTQWAIAIAERMELSPEEIANLQLVGPLHDLGKIAIPDGILNKASALNNAEQMLVAAHPMIGANLIAKIDALAPFVPIIRHHHERYDGTGYPDKFKGEDIPLLSRILAVADGFEAMTAERPYRSAKSQEEAAEELKVGAGTQWDPKVVEVFLKVLQEPKNAACLTYQARS